MRHCNYAISTGIIRVPPIAIGSCPDQHEFQVAPPYLEVGFLDEVARGLVVAAQVNLKAKSEIRSSHF
jgi:hypothetical protein